MSRSSEPSLPFNYSVHKFLNRFPTLRYDGVAIKCTVCDTYLAAWNFGNCMKHVKSRRHKENRQLNAPYWMFMYDLIFMLSVCNIPLQIIDNEFFRSFWYKYVPKYTLPKTSRLRRHIPRVKAQVENYIRSNLRNRKIWITVDESTDRKRNKVVNVLARILTPDTPSMSYLLSCNRVEQTTAKVIQQQVTQTLEKFDIKKGNVLMLVSDGTVHMIEAGMELKNVFPNLLHVTCLLHTLHHVEETIGDSYLDVDSLIVDTKLVFTNSPKRIREFHQFCPGIPEPPELVLTKWGTWLKSAFYYSEHFQAVKSVVSKFDPQNSAAVIKSQEQFSNPQVEADLRIIKQNYTILTNAMDELEEASASLAESFRILDSVKIALKKLQDIPGITAANKLDSLLDENPDLAKLRRIAECLSLESCEDNFRYFKYVNMTSVDVERSFSKYNAVFTEKRTNLNESRLEGILMLEAFAQIHPVFSGTNSTFWTK